MTRRYWARITWDASPHCRGQRCTLEYSSVRALSLLEQKDSAESSFAGMFQHGLPPGYQLTVGEGPPP